MATTIKQSIIEGDIALLTLDMPDKSVNILAKDVLEELRGILDELEQRGDLAGLIITSGKPGSFIAGADLREFVASLDASKDQIRELSQQGQRLFAKLSTFPGVTVAAIDGICVGGGAELSVWCDRRVLTNNPKTEFGFPEVKLGLFPGWGGTARTPRIAGLYNAVEMITSGESIDADKALAVALADDVVAPEQLVAGAVRIIRQEQANDGYRATRQQWNGPVEMDDTELAFLGATASAYIQQQTHGQYPAPIAALETLLEGCGVDVESALHLEAEGLASLFGSPVNRALLNVFFLTDRNKKDRGIDGEEISGGEVSSVGVIGAGIMGAGIAAANAKRGVPVVVTDTNAEALQKGVRQALEEAAYDRKTKKPSWDKGAEALGVLRGTLSESEITACDLVIEAIVENPDIKRELYARLEPQLGEQAILASNTSTLPITELAKSLSRPEKFCGIHFFNPVRRMKLVEIIRGEKTSDETIATAVAYAKRLGKFPIVVGDGPGFLVNRLLFPYMNEALELLREGVEIKSIERASKKFGMPMGPIELYDMVGLDTSLYAGATMYRAFPERTTASPVLPALIKAGRLGQKTGEGFFSYKNKKKKADADPELFNIIGDYIDPPQKMSPEEVTTRLFMPMLLEATRVLEEGIVRDVRDVDLGLIFGLGFPPFKGGLLFWADTLGCAQIIEMLAPHASLGSRFQPTPLLKSMARDNKRFYPQAK